MIIAFAIAIHVAGTIAGVAVLGELNYWQSAAPYWFATIILLYAYGTCYRSLSAQMLVAISRTGSRGIEVESLYDIYFRRVIQDRLDALIEGSRAEFRDGRLVVTRAGRSDAALLLWGRRVFGLKQSRLYFGKAAPDGLWAKDIATRRDDMTGDPV
jgi:hypothetical protein